MGRSASLVSHLIYHALLLVLWLHRHLVELFSRTISQETTRSADDRVCPAHVALAGDLDGRASSIARLALVAERLGAQTFSVCSHDDAAIEKACAQAGVGISVRVRSPSPRGAIVQYTRELASTLGSERNCDVNDISSVVLSLDKWHKQHKLQAEPDVLVLAPGTARCMASFSVWQLRLTQFRFCNCDVDNLDDDAFAQHISSAYGVAKRFGK